MFSALAFLVGPVGGVFVVPVAVGVMVSRPYQRDWTAAFLTLLCPVLGVSWLGYWFLDGAAAVCLVVAAVAVTALAVAMVTAVSDSRHERRSGAAMGLVAPPSRMGA